MLKVQDNIHVCLEKLASREHIIISSLTKTKNPMAAVLRRQRLRKLRSGKGRSTPVTYEGTEGLRRNLDPDSATGIGYKSFHKRQMKEHGQRWRQKQRRRGESTIEMLRRIS